MKIKSYIIELPGFPNLYLFFNVSDFLFSGEGEIMDMGEPQWLINYRNLVEQINSNNFDWSSHQSQTNSHAGKNSAANELKY